MKSTLKEALAEKRKKEAKPVILDITYQNVKVLCDGAIRELKLDQIEEQGKADVYLLSEKNAKLDLKSLESRHSKQNLVAEEVLWQSSTTLTLERSKLRMKTSCGPLVDPMEPSFTTLQSTSRPATKKLHR